MQGFRHWRKLLNHHMPERDDEELRRLFIDIDKDKVRGGVRTNVAGCGVGLDTFSAFFDSLC